LNDTTHWYHWGCTATSTAIYESLLELGYRIERIPVTASYLAKEVPAHLQDFDSPACFTRFSDANRSLVQQLVVSDVVVVNGEGSLHGFSGNARALLYLAYAAKKHLGKEVHIINHSCYPEDSLNRSDFSRWDFYRKVYAVADSVAVREPISYRLLKDAGMSAVPAFDCIPLFVRKHYAAPRRRDARKVLIAGSVAWSRSSLSEFARYFRGMLRMGYEVSVLTGARLLPAEDDQIFLKELRSVCAGGWRVKHAQSMDEWLNAIAGAGVLVSGRFHHTIAAAVLGTPFILFESNTPKNAGIALALGTPPPLSYAVPNLADILMQKTQSALTSDQQRPYQELSDRLCDLAATNFAALQGYRQESAAPSQKEQGKARPGETVTTEAEKYRKAWDLHDRVYALHSPGLKLSERLDFLGFFKTQGVRTVLDAGIGSGKLCRKMLSMGFDCHGVDIADNCLDAELAGMKDELLTIGALWDQGLLTAGAYDAVVCTDVLEHVPTERISEVIENFWLWTRRYVFLQIALFDDEFGRSVGEPLHLTVKPMEWWDAQLSSFKVILRAPLKDQRGSDMYAVYLLEKHGQGYVSYP
jgi:polysaccharide pyruvyl transferase WcaK-like protein